MLKHWELERVKNEMNSNNWWIVAIVSKHDHFMDNFNMKDILAVKIEQTLIENEICIFMVK